MSDFVTAKRRICVSHVNRKSFQNHFFHWSASEASSEGALKQPAGNQTLVAFTVVAGVAKFGTSATPRSRLEREEVEVEEEVVEVGGG